MNEEGGIHAGQHDEFGQEFFRARHGRRMSQPNALCHFLLDTRFWQVQSQTITVRTYFKNKSWLLIPMLFLFLVEFIPVVFATENSPSFIWVKQLGGTKSNSGESIAVDKTGNVYVTGQMDYESGQSIGTHEWYHKGGKVFLAKYDATGNLVWFQKFGGGSDNHAIGYGIAIDPLGNVYITGTFSGTINFNQTKLTSAGELDSFLAKFDPSGKLFWVKQSGGKNCFCQSYGIASDKKEGIYITGNFVGKAAFGSDDMISRSGIEPGHNSDVFLVKYNSSSGDMVWMRQAGEAGENTGHGIAVDNNDNVYVTGRFSGGQGVYVEGKGVRLSISFETIKITQMENIKNTDTNGNCLFNFITKYNSDGKVLWAKPTAGRSGSYGTQNSIAINKLGHIYVAGSFDFALKFDGISLTNTVDGNDEIFLVKYDANGKVLWGRSAGGTGHDECFGVAVDDAGNSYIVGDFMDSANFGNIHLQGKPHDSRLGPSSPLIVAKYNSSGDAVWVKAVDKADGYFAQAGSVTGLGVAVATDGNIYTTGDFGGIYAPISFDQFILKPVGNFFTGKGKDIFVAKLGTSGN